jgi:hypothetical protein
MRKETEIEKKGDRSNACFLLLAVPYKRTAKPKKTLPNKAARPRPALGMKTEPAPLSLLPLLLLELLLPVGSALPKPVAGIALVAVPEGCAVEAMVVGREVLPRYGS